MLYTLDESWRRAEMVENFESLIWTERVSTFGDFELTIENTPGQRELLKPGGFLGRDGAYRVMMIERVEETENVEGASILKIRGDSLEKHMKYRAAYKEYSAAGVGEEPKWKLTGTATAIARQIFEEMVRQGKLGSGTLDQMTFSTSSVFPLDNLTGNDNSTKTMYFEPTNVYDLLVQITEAYDLGWRIVRNFDEGGLMFNVYGGRDRTSSQRTDEAVIFSRGNTTLDSINTLKSIEEWANIAYVFSKNGSRRVAAPGVTNPRGFDRRVLSIYASDIDFPAGSVDLDEALMSRAYEELAKRRPVFALDGEVTPYSIYEYEKHYRLGDTVEQRDDEELINKMRVTEHIFSYDGEGVKSYPTLTSQNLAEPGTWYHYDFQNLTWSTFGERTWPEVED